MSLRRKGSCIFSPIKEKLVNVVLKIDDGYQIAGYLSSTGYI